MSIQRFISGILLVLLWLLTACSVNRSFEEPLLTPSPTPTLLSTTPAHLPTPSPSVPASAIPSSTYAPPSLTPPPHPAPISKEERAFVREMLATNGGCELPCWWGITPGADRWSDVQDRLGLSPEQGWLWPDGARLHEIIYGDLMYPPPPPYGYYIHIDFIERNEIVQSIHVSAEVVQRTTPERFATDWRRYSLDQVLTRYGEPSQVMLELWPNPPEPYYPYRLFLFYEERGFLIRYEGPAIPGETLEVCPDFKQVTRLDLWLQSPLEKRPLLELAYSVDPYERAQMLPLEEATGMDVRTFYETFQRAGATVCLKSPAEVWPQH